MSHEVLGSRFLADRAAPAWHGLMAEGVDPSKRYTAAEAYELIGKLPVTLAKLQTQGKSQSGEHLQIPYQAIVRGPIPEDPQPQVFGVVGMDYVLVRPERIVELWDEHVQRHVNTMIHLRDGKLMVISSTLEGFRVAGEDVDTYVMIGNWMDGANASTAMLSCVSPVCMNTWRMASERASESYRFRHDQDIEYRMTQWFRQVIERAEAKLPQVREAMDALASYRLTRDNAKPVTQAVLTAAYPEPKQPEPDPLAPPERNEERLEKYEVEKRMMGDRRVTALELFKGEGTGMRTQARLATLWGLYQAVVEVEDYRGGSAGNALASSILFGDRAATKDRAFSAALAVAKAG